MDKLIGFMFSGQGSQYYNMGHELYKGNNIFRKWMLRLDKIVIDIIGESIVARLYDGEKVFEDKFDRTFYTHPAIFMLEYSLARVLVENGIEPDFVLGTSLGEFTSAALSEVIGIEESMELLVKQAEIIETHCPKGGMLSILHKPELYYKTAILYENSELASVNYSSHFVVSGHTEGLIKIKEFLYSRNIIFQDLPVAYGFHSSLIDPAELPFIDFLTKKTFEPPKIPFVSGLYAKVITSLSGDYFWKVARQPVNFPRTIYELEKNSKNIYLDLGPSGTLSNFVKRNIHRESLSQSYHIVTPFGKENEKLNAIFQLFFK
ncbi:acyltransferase domain-containing protein [Desulfocucumis palustris]|nr:acyltransferase domain-containing protein [Desulfocucumis palustris]